MSGRVAAVLAGSLFLALLGACSDEKERPVVDGQGGTSVGGSGGGGSGGSAGSGGGSGGSGGKEIACGDGDIEGDEECDDGNLVDGDGCSSGCMVEGSCERPLEWAAIRTPVEGAPGRFTSEELVLRKAVLSDRGGCMTEEGQRRLVVHWVADATGLLEFVSADDGPGFSTAAYVRQTCEVPTSELFGSCSKRRAVQVDVRAGQDLFFIVDSSAEAEIHTTLTAEIFPYRQEGETCGPAPGVPLKEATCGPGLTCWDAANRGVCSFNLPPVLTAARAIRAGLQGEDLIVYWEGGDPNGDAFPSPDAWAFDAEGAPVTVYNFYPDAPNSVGLVDELTAGAGTYSFSPGILADHPEIRRIDLQLRDTGGLVSETLSTFIVDQPQRATGESCDPLGIESLCESTDLACGDEGDGAVCLSLLPIRQARCDDARLLEIGKRIRIDWEKTDLPPQIWTPPDACFARLLPTKSKPEFAFRLRLDEDLTNVRVRAPSTSTLLADAVVSLYDGCGTEGPPIACHETTAPADPSTVAFDTLAAGDYLVVIHINKASFGSGAFLLEVLADELP